MFYSLGGTLSNLVYSYFGMPILILSNVRGGGAPSNGSSEFSSEWMGDVDSETNLLL